MKIRISALFFWLCLMTVLLTGCSRAEMNAQIAESIGTLGMYENNEPVETPKMKAQREMQEASAAVEDELTGHLERAQRLAASYDYSSALEELALIDENYQDDERVISAKIEYQRLQGTLENYGGDIAHFSVKSLIADPTQAFDGDDMSYYYNNWSLTVDEFKAILQSLYDKGYILMSIYDVVTEVENEDGTTSFASNSPLVPHGKTPIILSFVEANYYSDYDNNGFSDRMVLSDDGTVLSEYQDASGQTITGAYDVVPIVDEFVEEHPDFSLRGAKGIVSVTGYQGVFGYGIETGGSEIKAIADAMKENGWLIASNGYSNSLMESELDADTLAQDMEEWSDKVGSLVGETNLLIYPFGEAVTEGSYKHAWLMENGYQYFFNLWATSDYLVVYSDYVVQSRRVLDGYDLYYYGDTMTDFFDADAILDSRRPDFE